RAGPRQHHPELGAGAGAVRQGLSLPHPRLRHRPGRAGRARDRSPVPAGAAAVSRVPPVDPAAAPPELREIYARQVERWGAPLAPTLAMGHCPPIAVAAARLSVALERSATP